MEFAARAELCEKVEKARALLSHALPSGDLGELFERALDALLEQETRKRFGAKALRKTSKVVEASKTLEAPEAPPEAPMGPMPPKARRLERSRHVPVHVERAVWVRDGGQCTHVDAEGQRCRERQFLTIEHLTPFALGGSHTLDNLCLLCRPHNLQSARQVFGESLIQAKIRARTKRPRPPPARAGSEPPGPMAPHRPVVLTSSEDRAARPPPLDEAAKLQAALRQLGFQRSEASAVVGRVVGGGSGSDVEQLLRECLLLWCRLPAEGAAEL